MVDSRDQLFLRLCVRQGVYTKDEANELLAYYRDSAGVKEGIGHFLVREGYLDEAVADKFRHAIAKRADGHVVDSRKKVPSLNKTRGAGRASGGVRHRHVPAQATSIKADPMQLTMIGVGMVVLIVAVIWLVWEMNSGSSPDEIIAKSQEETQAQRQDRLEKERKAKADAAREALASADTRNVSYSASQLEEFEDRAHEARRTAREACIDIGKGPKLGLKIIDAEIEAFKAEGVPADHLKVLQDARKEVIAMFDVRYNDLKSSLDRARANNEEAEADDFLTRIKKECGEEYYEKAK